jgi:excisionase family DNA binding protein
VDTLELLRDIPRQLRDLADEVAALRAAHDDRSADVDGFVSVTTACRLSGLGKSKLYELMRNGKLKRYLPGGKTLLEKTELYQFIRSHLVED